MSGQTFSQNPHWEVKATTTTVDFRTPSLFQNEKSDFEDHSPTELTHDNLHKIESVYDYMCVVSGDQHRSFLLSCGVGSTCLTLFFFFFFQFTSTCILFQPKAVAIGSLSRTRKSYIFVSLLDTGLGPLGHWEQLKKTMYLVKTQAEDQWMIESSFGDLSCQTQAQGHQIIESCFKNCH